MRIIWSDLAKASVQEIYFYYKEVTGIKAAKSIKNKIINKPRLLAKHPEMGQVEDNPMVVNRGFRYLIEGNHKIVYKWKKEKRQSFRIFWPLYMKGPYLQA